MSTLVGLFYAQISSTIMVSNYKLYIDASLPYLPNPSAWAGYDTRSFFFFKRSLTGLNSEFSF